MTPSTDAALKHACRMFSFFAWVIIATAATFILGWFAMIILIMVVMA